MSAYSVFLGFDQKLAAPLQAFVSQGSANLAAAVSGPMTAAVTLYVIITGILIMLGRIDTPLSTIAMRVLKIGIILAMVRQASMYQTFVTNIFFEAMPREIASALSTGSPISASALDGLLAQVQTIANDILSKAGWDSTMFTYAFTAIVLVLIAGVSLGVCFCVLMFAKICLALVLALGPLFIACALFDATRRLFEAWVGQLLNFVILQVLVLTLGSLLISIVGSMINTNSGLDFLVVLVSLSATFMVSGYILYQLPGLAAALAAGGASLAYGYHARNDAASGLVGKGTIQAVRSVAGGVSKGVGALRNQFFSRN